MPTYKMQSQIMSVPWKARNTFTQEQYVQKEGGFTYAGSRSYKTNHPWHRPHMSPIVIVNHLKIGKKGQISDYTTESY